jgi:nucleotide-binding universal stress UspA family protein
MKKIKKVLVGLDLTQMDGILIKNTTEVVQLMEIEMVYFVHVTKDLTIPNKIKKSHPDLLAPADEVIEKDITGAVRQAGFPEEVGFEVEAKEGDPLETMLRWSKVKNVDLIIMGRKNNYKGSGSLAKKAAHKSPCSVLFFTESQINQKITQLMVPIDFSSYSLLSLHAALEIAKDPRSIKCYHLYDVPSGYSKIGKSYEEFSEIMLKNAKDDYQEFIKKNNLPELDCTFILKKEDNKAKTLLEVAAKEGIDFIIIGSRGRTDSASMVIGSVVENLININNEIPMLILKKKGETMKFLEALFRV